jgi:hypothetical protein
MNQFVDFSTVDFEDVLANPDVGLFDAAYPSAHGGWSTINEPTVSSSGGLPTTNQGTISPKDLMRDPYPQSAPNSAALTHLTSPSLYESPSDPYETSPLFDANDVDPIPGQEQWYSLFPKNESSEDSPPVRAEDLDEPATSAGGSTRRKSSPGQSGLSRGNSKHSTVSGVGARKRNSPLPPIVVDDPSDTVALKRARNTLAARKSRARKMEKFEELEGRIAELQKEVAYWKEQATGKTE